jgi:hypothetical protein
MRALVLDNEAVQALRDERHPKHRQVLAHLAGIVGRRRRGREVAAVVPTSVRVEAGWDRTQPAAAAINRLRSPTTRSMQGRRTSRRPSLTADGQRR